MKRWIAVVLAALATLALIALGIWQVERREWKLALIERVEQRVHAPPVAAPGPGEWPQLTRENAEYRRVEVRGEYLPGREVLVKAVTELGAGYWAMAPLVTDRGFTVLINRGFVPPAYAKGGTRTPPEEPTGPVQVVGLLRVSEPHGAFLRNNAPAEERWYSRDVAAISQARDLTGAAPYFIDAEAAPTARAGAPVGGLTVIAFRNSHLTYALTWFALALLSAVLAVRLVRHR